MGNKKPHLTVAGKLSQVGRGCLGRREEMYQHRSYIAMARRTHLPTPSPEQIRALLDEAGLSAYAAAPLIGVSVQALQQAITGATVMRGSAWLLLRIMLSQSARDELPTPRVQ